MENALALVRDDAGVWRDQEGHHPFHGLSHEYPMDHIKRFEDLVTSIKYNGVSNDFLFCKLFPYSLAGEAANWLKQFEPGSLTTWKETRNAFLHNFYDDARSEELRLKISTFSQGLTEAFKAAWMALDAASNGNFNTRYPEDAVVLIKNLASSNSTKNADYQRMKQGGNMDGSQIAEVKELDSVHSLLVGKKSVRYAANVKNFEPDEALEEEDVNFINGAGFQGQRFGTQPGNMNYRGNNQRSTFTGNQNSSGYNSKPQYQTSYSNDSFSRNYGSPPLQTPDNEVKSMLEQILEGQQKMTMDFNGKIDALYLDLNGKIEVLNTHVKKLDTQVAQTAESVKRQEGFFPRKTDTNPRHYCSAISLRSGKKLTPVLKKNVSEDEIMELDESKENFKVAEPMSSDTTTSVARHQSQSEAEVVQNPKPTEERVYKPKVPYPRSPKKSKKELDDARYKALMEKLVIEIPLVIAPTLRHYVKRMVTNNLSHEEGVMMISEHVSAVIQIKIPEKLADPRSFVLDCSIFSERFKRSLCDLGSSVNLMPYSVAVSLGMTDFKPTKISLILADRSKRIPKGVLEDVPIKVGDCIIPTDFVVLEYGEEPKDPLILGRSFLATAGEVIDVKHGNLDLHLGDTIMTFKMEKLKDSTIDGQTFQVSAIPEVIVGDQNVFDAEKVRDQPELTKTSTEPVTAVDQEAQNISLYSSPPKQRYAPFEPNPNSRDIIGTDSKDAGSVSRRKLRDYRRTLGFSIDDISGNRSRSPEHRSHPGVIPAFLGRPHARNAYTLPWMRRLSQRHSLPLSDPPDA
ncbi:uncharacterized protein LOC112085105 [Eutrema salsugineum]|uniref:uncharacterized protein LOC112085105 n=1 Tax=Eutrema salsugineum TaxID=72664 RepID=UPI000CECE88A|nr:uncharacterized protein LOC112085105 [Eutrema salsugineum]